MTDRRQRAESGSLPRLAGTGRARHQADIGYDIATMPLAFRLMS